jgi:hypothetical protein
MFSSLIPFSGFYGSIHNSYMDDVLEMREAEVSDWRNVFEEYAKEYVKKLAEWMDVSLEYEELISPKEYNFMNDRIFAEISRSDFAKILCAVRGTTLNNKVRQMFTSRSGFISHYPNRISEWGRISTWDHNQIGAVLAAYVDKYRESDDIEANIAESIYEDGTLESIMLEG